MKGVDTGKMVQVPARWLAEAQSILLTGNDVPVPNQLERVFALLVEMAREAGSDIGVTIVMDEGEGEEASAAEDAPEQGGAEETASPAEQEEYEYYAWQIHSKGIGRLPLGTDYSKQVPEGLQRFLKATLRNGTQGPESGICVMGTVTKMKPTGSTSPLEAMKLQMESLAHTYQEVEASVKREKVRSSVLAVLDGIGAGEEALTPEELEGLLDVLAPVGSPAESAGQKEGGE